MTTKHSYADVISSAKVMLAGLKSNSARVSKRGGDAAFISRLEEARKNAQSLDDEQEDLKGKLKTKTAALESTVGELEKLMSEARKMVKLEMEKESWKSFGIADVR